MKYNKILWASVGMHLNTGYGKVTRYVVTGLKNRGYDVITYNAHLIGGKMYIEGVLNLPRINDTFGSDSISMYYRAFERDVLITLWDVWVLRWIKGTGMRWIPWVPVDSELDEYTLEINEPLNYDEVYAIVAMSEFGREQIRKVVKDKEVVYIPHGVDIKLYRPMDKSIARKEVNVPTDSFVFGNVSANIGDRKELPTLMKSFRIFLDDNPDARDVVMIIWTNIFPKPGQSFDIVRLAKRYGIAGRIISPAMQPPNVWYDEEFMPFVFNSMDWYVTASRGEGFGLPLLESQACGVPVVAPDNSAHRELVGDRGILVRPRLKVLTLTVPTHQEYPVVDPHDLAEAMGRAYNRGSGVCRDCIEFARRLSWDAVVDMWDRLIQRI